MTAIASPGSPIPNSAEQSGFEGPEKVLELDLVPGVGPQTGMRTLPRATWSSILDEAKCSILCKTGNQDFDAYVLSESSLFVYPHKVVVKTCGTTTLLCIIPALLRAVEARVNVEGRRFIPRGESPDAVLARTIASEDAGAICTLHGVAFCVSLSRQDIGMEVEWVAFSRKDFLYPQQQLFPHRNAQEEINFLREYFPDGKAYMLGPLTADHWFVFVADYCTRPSEEATDRTLDIMMYGIDDRVAAAFAKDPAALGLDVGSQSPESKHDPDALSPSGPRHDVRAKSTSNAGSDDGPEYEDKDEDEGCADDFPRSTEAERDDKDGRVDWEKEEAHRVTTQTGIDRLLPGSTIQEFLFDPCGYSMNGLLFDAYWTIHVTPEHHCSYASFETNVRQTSYAALLRAVLHVFQPRRFTVTLFADQAGLQQMSDLPMEPYVLPHSKLAYRLTDRSHTEFMGDYCSYLMNYSRVEPERVPLHCVTSAPAPVASPALAPRQPALFPGGDPSPVRIQAAPTPTLGARPDGAPRGMEVSREAAEGGGGMESWSPPRKLGGALRRCGVPDTRAVGVVADQRMAHRRRRRLHSVG